MKNSIYVALIFSVSTFYTTTFARPISNPTPATKHKTAAAEEIKVPAGFSVQVIATDLGTPRHLTIAKNGDIYAKLKTLKNGKGIYLLRDTNNDGVIDETKLFGNFPGTGIQINNGFLYASSNKGIYRYKMNDKNEVIDMEHPENIVDGLVDKGRDNAKPFVFDNKDNLYVAVGSYNDACRVPGTGKGMVPCSILDSAGGIWKFNVNVLGQQFKDGSRYMTGLKNAVGVFWNTKTNSLFSTAHGRGTFHDFYPQYYTPQQSQEIPAEAIYEIHEGDDAGWPYIYYDQFQKKKILAPEYGGDGKKVAGEKAIDPTVVFPAHLGPNDLLFYTGKMFPSKYKNGAFVAFHGQSAELKKGYFIAFVPFKNNKPSGNWEIFADNFAGIDLAKPTGPVQHRPCGLAEGPDGALYVCDDLNGSIYRIGFNKK